MEVDEEERRMVLGMDGSFYSAERSISDLLNFIIALIYQKLVL
jgi:hypothetical protein